MIIYRPYEKNTIWREKMKKKLLAVVMSVTMAAGVYVAMPAEEAKAESESTLENGLVAEYLFDGDFADELDEDSVAKTYGTDGATKLVANDSERGNVVSLAGGIITHTEVPNCGENKNLTWFKKTAPSGIELPDSIIEGNNYSDGITISMWLKSSTGNDAYASILDISDQNGDFSWGHIAMAAAPQFRYNGWALSGVSGNDWFEIGNDPAANKTSFVGDEGWELLTITISDSKVVVYFDAEAVITSDDANHTSRLMGFIANLAKSGRATFRMGVFQTPGDWNWSWNAYAGFMDDVRVWNRALTAAEVGELVDVAADTSVVPVEEPTTEAPTQAPAQNPGADDTQASTTVPSANGKDPEVVTTAPSGEGEKDTTAAVGEKDTTAAGQKDTTAAGEKDTTAEQQTTTVDSTNIAVSDEEAAKLEDSAKVEGDKLDKDVALKVSKVEDKVVEAVKEAAKEVLKDKVYATVDLKLVKGTEVVQANGDVKVTINVPEKVKNAKVIEVFRLDADKLVSLGKADVKDGKISFTTNHFSTYVFADVTPVATDSEPGGDTAPVMMLLAIAAVAGAAVVASKKKNVTE